MDGIRLAIEASLWDSEDGATPPDLTVVEQPDRIYWCGGSDTPYANRIVRLAVSAAEVDATISEILDFYAARGKAFSWGVGPSSTPADLGQRLMNLGLRLLDTYEGVALPLTGPLPEPTADVQVEQVVDEAGVRAMVGISAEIWGYSGADQERIVAERLEHLAAPGRRGGYLLARVDGRPAGTANYRYSSDGQVLYMTGASTLPGYRGRGVFRALVAWRLAQAQARGARLATCLARSGTSAPILLRLGFREHMRVQVYTL